MSEHDSQNKSIEALREELQIMKKVNEIAMFGWWYVNFTTQTYTGSEFIQDFIGIPENKLTFEEFSERVHPEHSERVNRNILLFSDVGFYEDKFPFMTKYGYRWMHAKLGEKVINAEGEVEAFGYVRFLDEKEIEVILDNDAETQIENVISNYMSITSSLLNLQNSPDYEKVIRDTLKNIISQFNADRVYIFEFNKEERTQSCIFEVVSDGISSEQNMLQDIPLSETQWWSDKLLNNVPIIINSVDNLPQEAESTKSILQIQNIKSVLAIPIMSHDSIWGYMGIDIVKENRIWSNLDKQWLFAIGNIMGLCMALKKSEQMSILEKVHFRELYENMPIGFLYIKILYDKNGDVADYIHLEVNRAFELITNIKREQVIGMLRSSLGVLKDEMKKELQDVLSHRTKESHFKVVEVNKDKYYQYSAYSPEPDHVIITFQEITETVNINRALSRSEANLRNVYNNLPTGLEIYNKEGILTDINEKELAIFGVPSKEDVVGIVNIFDNPNIPKEHLDKLLSGEDIDFECKYDFFKVKNSNYYNTSGNNTKHISVKGTVLFDSNNDIECYLLTVIDNTETIKAFERIQEFEILFDSISEFSEIGLSNWDPFNHNFSATEQWYYNLGLKGSKVDNPLNAYTYMDREDAVAIKQKFDDLISGKTSFFHYEARIKTLEGNRWLRCSYKTSKFAPEKNEIEIIGFNINITELKKTEIKLREAKLKAEESDRLKSAFVANMSHEIRTPLNAIVGFSELLIQTEDVEEKEQYSSLITKNNNLLLQLISDILDISRIESGITDVVFEEFDVNSMLDEVLYSNTLKTTPNVPLIIDKRAENYIIKSDKNRLMQIFNNLVGNAIKFTLSGDIHVGYNILGDKIRFYVKDTGLGIDEDNIDKIFDRFVKLNTFIQGTGLGLPICKSLVEKLDGEMWVESKKGEGSCFWIELTYCSEITSVKQLCKNTDSEQKELVEDNSRRKPLIMIAEDTDSNYILMAELLKKDYTLIRARDGVEALELLKQMKPDIILMDMRMPNMGGLETTREIRKTDSVTPIIAVTAFAFEDDKNAAAAAGCNAHISKPVNNKLLREVLTKYLN